MGWNKGLHVDGNGKLLLNGETFYGMGLNFFDGFSRSAGTGPESDYETSIRKISENGIPFIRLMFGEYYASGLREYRDNPARYFQRMDRFVQTAEKYRVGILASLFWWIGGFPDLAGESLNRIGQTGSVTLRLAKQYVNDVVTRYRSSPALWGWEIGNEYNLTADISSFSDDRGPVGAHLGAPEVRTDQDYVTSDDVRVFYEEIAKEIRSIDGYRVIINGDADYRPFQYHLRMRSQQQDTEEDLLNAIKIFSPDPINVLSVHIYELDQVRFNRSCPFEDLIRVYKNLAGQLNKPLYLGEFGGSESEERFQRQIHAIVQADIVLSSPWNYNMIGLTHGSFTDDGYGSHMFRGTAEMNRQYRQTGRQTIRGYWEAVGKEA